MGISTLPQPFVSIIIPVYNNGKELQKVLTSLNEQTYPNDRYEIIVVDNGSNDGTIDVVRQYSNVTLLYEHTYKNSPYSARNRGIEVARGAIIAFLDATCEPGHDWISFGVRDIANEQVDLVGGEVIFRGRKKPTATNIYESMTTLRVKHSIETKGTMMTANLFVSKKVIDDIGYFPEGIRSGGDVQWTAAASRKGYKLIYCKDAVVYKSYRSLPSFLRKIWRFAKAKPTEMRRRGESVHGIKTFIASFNPPGFKGLRKRMQDADASHNENYLIRLWLLHYATKIIYGWGAIYSWFLAKK
jgi:glycosyltransferase AglE